jgi:hypothetical protein
MKLKVEPDDLEVVLAIVDVCTGKRSAGAWRRLANL